jgi:hypothetical protein
VTKIHQSQQLTRWKGRDLTLADIARESGISHPTLISRYNAGARGDYLTRPVRARTVQQNLQQASA